LNTLSFVANRKKPLTIYCPPGAIEQVRSIVGWFDSINYTVNVKELIPGSLEQVAEHYRIDTLDTSSYSAYGLRFTERNPRGTFNRERAEALGVPVGPKFSRLCDGESVEAEDGSIVEPDDVLGVALDPLTVVFSGRTERVDTVRNATQQADILAHDASVFEHFSVSNDRASVSDAVEVANASQPDVLLLTRLMSNIAHWTDKDLVDAAKESRDGIYGNEGFLYGDTADSHAQLSQN
jgi:ribonuclease Z